MPVKKIWSQEDRNFIYEQFRFQNKTLHWIAEQLNTNRQGVGKLIKEENWLRAYEDPEWLYEMNWIEGKTFDEMSQDANCNLDTIRVNFRKHNLDANTDVRYRGVRKYEVNESYFDNIDSHEKAYWIGFITADGGIEHIGCNAYRLGFNLAVCDKAHLEKFKAQINSTHPIKDYDTTLDVTGKTYTMSNFRISNSHICHTLMSYNILPNKSANEKPCLQIPDEYINSYIRGYFDGDGSFTYAYVERRGRYVGNFNIIGSEELLTYFAEVLSEKFEPKKLNIRDMGALKRFDIGADEKISSIYNWLYDGQETYLERKKQAFDEYFALTSDIVRSSGESPES